MGRAAHLVAAASLLLCVGIASMPVAAAGASVAIEGTAFRPPTITVTAGDTVVWTNLDGAAHTVTSNTGVWDSGTIRGSGGTFSRAFATTGTFEYFCHLHSWMLGTVVGRAVGAPSPTPARQLPTAPPSVAPIRTIATAEPLAAAAPTVALPERVAASNAEGAPGPVLVALAGVVIAGIPQPGLVARPRHLRQSVCS